MGSFGCRSTPIISIEKRLLVSFYIGQECRVMWTKSRKFISANLPSATDDPDSLIAESLTADLENQTVADQLTEITNIEDHFIFSPLDLVPQVQRQVLIISHTPRERSYNCHRPKS